MCYAPRMLILLALATATPPDVLAGVTLGQAIQRDGWLCTPDACSRPANVAGVGGTLSATLCGDTVRKLRFSRTLVQASDVGNRNREDERALANEGLFLVDDVGVATSNAYLALADGMATAGWSSGEKRVHKGEPFISAVDFVATDGRVRTLSTIIGSERTPKGTTTVVHLRLETASLACASGL